MAQSALTVTPPSPTPPTNMSFTGATGPNPPNYRRDTYANPVSAPPPYFDDGSAGSLVALAANTAALASGTTAADNGTGTTAGTNAAGAGGTGFNSVAGSYPGASAGAVPASTSVAHEGAGTEVVVTATVPNPSPNGQLQTVSVLGNRTSAPNGDHASSLSPTGAPTITTFSPVNTASGGGTFALTVNGTNFTRQTVIYINDIAQATTFVSSTQVTLATALKRPTAGTYPVFARTAGIVETAPTNYTYT